VVAYLRRGAAKYAAYGRMIIGKTAQDEEKRE